MKVPWLPHEFLVEIQGGEPLIRKDFIEIIRKFKKENIAVKILTNGTLINETIARALSELLDPITDSIQISLDGSWPEINDKIRGKGSFTRIVEGIKLCTKYNISLSVNTTLMNENAADLVNIYKLAVSLGVPRYSFFTLMKAGRGKNLEIDFIEKALTQIIKIKELEKKKQYKTVVNGSLGYEQTLPDYPEAFQKVFGNRILILNRNTAGVSSADIDHKGDVYPSSYLQFPELKAGNILRESLIKLWKTKKWGDVRRTFTNIYGKCIICDRLKVCGGGTRTTSYIFNHCFNMSDSQCVYNPIIDLDDFIIRPPKVNDFSFLRNLWANPEVMSYVGFPNGLKQPDRKIKNWIENWQKNGLRLIIEDKKERNPSEKLAIVLKKNN